jgi:hypothetical protein
VGIASGINNAVSRAAGLLAIAALGIVMLHVFNRSIDSRLSNLEVSAEVRRSLEDQRITLAATTIPQDIAPPIRQDLKRAINESFVRGFRRVMLLGAVLALASGVTSLLLISGDAKDLQNR